MKNTLTILTILAAMPAFAESARELDSHEHGVGELNIAIDGKTVAMELHAPGADIVGFEYEAESDTDLAAIEKAVATLSAPLALFELPAAASCAVTSAKAELESEDSHDEEHHEDHGDKHEDHEDHAKDDHHDHDEHAKDEHDEHHDDHAEKAGHTEFHAEYVLTCDNPDAVNEITFAYFEAFPNAKEVEVQIVTSSGAQAFEVERDSPVLKLER